MIWPCAPFGIFSAQCDCDAIGKTIRTNPVRCLGMSLDDVDVCVGGNFNKLEVVQIRARNDFLPAPRLESSDSALENRLFGLKLPCK